MWENLNKGMYKLRKLMKSSEIKTIDKSKVCPNYRPGFPRVCRQAVVLVSISLGEHNCFCKILSLPLIFMRYRSYFLLYVPKSANYIEDRITNIEKTWRL